MRIYLLDKELIVIRTIKNFLKDLGHEVIAFDDIVDLIENKMEKDIPVELIIINLDMPEDICIRVVRQIHKQYPDSAIVIMSSVLPSKEAISNGVFSYLKKPIRFNELELLLARILERQTNIKLTKQLETKDIKQTQDSSNPYNTC